jgi:hypothetical protein
MSLRCRVGTDPCAVIILAPGVPLFSPVSNIRPHVSCNKALAREDLQSLGGVETAGAAENNGRVCLSPSCNCRSLLRLMAFR